MKISPDKAELEMLQLKQKRAQLDKLLHKQAIGAKKLKTLSSRILYLNKNQTETKMKRLQVRSFPLGCKISIDDKDTGEVTPHTFEDLEVGEHEVEIHYRTPKTDKITSKSEKVIIRDGKRVVCKLYFKQPKTLSEAQTPNHAP